MPIPWARCAAKKASGLWACQVVSQAKSLISSPDTVRAYSIESHYLLSPCSTSASDWQSLQKKCRKSVENVAVESGTKRTAATIRPDKAEDSRSLQAKKTSSTLTAFRQLPYFHCSACTSPRAGSKLSRRMRSAMAARAGSPVRKRSRVSGQSSGCRRTIQPLS